MPTSARSLLPLLRSPTSPSFVQSGLPNLVCKFKKVSTNQSSGFRSSSIGGESVNRPYCSSVQQDQQRIVSNSCFEGDASGGTLFHETLSRTYHNQHKPYKCSYCDKVFDRKSNCVRHERSHTGDKPYSCMYCGKAYITKANLQYHILKSQDHAALRSELALPDSLLTAAGTGILDGDSGGGGGLVMNRSEDTAGSSSTAFITDAAQRY